MCTFIFLQNLLLAKERELESEDHMTKLASREEARIVQDMKRIDQVKQSLNERKNAYQVRFSFSLFSAHKISW